MYLVIFFAVLFLAGAISNFVQGDPENGWVGLAISAVLVAADRTLCGLRHREQGELHGWLWSHGHDVLDGGATYRGVHVQAHTRVRTFDVAVSLGVLSWLAPSRDYVVGVDRIWPRAIFFTLVTLLLGWWGLPWGPIYTVRALATNLGGGRRTTVHGLIQEIGPLPPRPRPTLRRPTRAAIA